MTPRVARVAVFGFVAAGVGVWCNVMYLQGVDRSTILARGPSIGASGPRIAQAPRLEYSERVDQGTPPTISRDDADVVRAVQRELSQSGYNPGPTDGSATPVTRAAIMAYEYDHGLPVTGEATQDLLKAMLFGRERLAAAPSGDLGTQTGPQAQQVIRSVQQSLAKLGYAIGRPDGRLGEETARAIRKFEAEQGLPSTGRISGQLVLKLTEAAARRGL
jgi:peptidoglycan hydrolase-like protein with peptidoglycan-binding domain